MNKPRALDLFCGAGGATRGLQNAGFHVTGVDINPQPNYCGDSFIQSDALCMRPKLLACIYQFIWASPPCQAHTLAQRIRKNDHPDLIERTRELLRIAGRPCVIENVPGAPLLYPEELCGSMFGLKTYRHRWFEASFPLVIPPHNKHRFPQAKMGRPPKLGEFIQVVGNFSNVARAREAMGIDWMTRNELSESIPPAYSEFIARQFLEVPNA